MRYVTACLCFFSLISGGFFLLHTLSPPAALKELPSEDPDAEQSLKDQIPYGTIGHMAGSPAPGNDVAKKPFIRDQFTLELGKVGSQKEAEGWLDRLRESGLKGFYTPYHAGPEVIYRIRSGLYTDQQQAIKAQGQLLSGHNLKASVVRL